LSVVRARIGSYHSPHALYVILISLSCPLHRVRTAYAGWAVNVPAPRTWNTLPAHVVTCDNWFCRRL